MAKFVSNPKRYSVTIRSLGKVHSRTTCGSLSEAKALTQGLANGVVASIAVMEQGMRFQGCHVMGDKVEPYSCTESGSLVKAYRKRSIQPIREKDMLSPKIVQMWIVAREHGFKARPNLTDGLELEMPWSQWGGNEDGKMVATRGIEKIQCHDLRSLKLALGY